MCIRDSIGSVFVAANSIAGVLNQLVFISVSGVANAAAVLTGKTIGEGGRVRVQKVANTLPVSYTHLGVFPLAVAVNLLNNYFFFAGQIVFLFLYFFIKLLTGEYRITPGRFGRLAFESLPVSYTHLGSFSGQRAEDGAQPGCGPPAESSSSVQS